MKHYIIFYFTFWALLPVENIMTVFSHIPDCLKASVTFFIASSITDTIPIHWKAAGILFEYLCRRKCKFGNNKRWWKVVWWNNLSFPQSRSIYSTELKTFKATFYSSSQLIIFVNEEYKVALKVIKRVKHFWVLKFHKNSGFSAITWNDINFERFNPSVLNYYIMLVFLFALYKPA